MSGFWGKVWGGVSGASNWMENNKVATNLIGSVLVDVGGYFAQKEQAKDMMRQQRELLNLQNEMKSKYSAVPDVDFSYNSLTIDESPNLANGGILTELKKRSDEKKGFA
ncbi:hypothetical protein GVX76_07025 [[Haemophilus] felis]|nr:hypothetical protein [[Haemophilus] felis]